MSQLLPAALAERAQLNDEIHARPPLPIAAEECVLYLALLVDGAARIRERELLLKLAGRHTVVLREPLAAHLVFAPTADPQWRLKYERHGEFSSWWLYRRGAPNPPLRDADLRPLLGDLALAELPGQLLVAIEARVDSQHERLTPAQAAAHFAGAHPIGSEIGGGAGRLYTDFRIDADGWTRLWIRNHGLGEGQCGRYLQRLLEIESYRMMALRSLPVAQMLLPQLEAGEAELAAIAQQLAAADGDVRDLDRQLLHRLSLLAGKVEGLIAAHGVRFTAAEAYGELVQRRLAELREEPISGTQSLSEFMARRLTPALRTCEWTARRLHELSQRIARQSQLLRTRVEIEQEQQTQALLASMDRRAQLQLRLQETVEGLSVVAISYYGASVLGIALRALKSRGVDLDPTLWTGLALIPIALITALGLRRLRRRLHG